MDLNEEEIICKPGEKFCLASIQITAVNFTLENDFMAAATDHFKTVQGFTVGKSKQTEIN